MICEISVFEELKFPNMSQHASAPLSRCINFKVLAVVLKPLMAPAAGHPGLGLSAEFASNRPTKRMISTDWNVLLL